MASSQKRAHQRRIGPSWFLACFGFGRKRATGSEIKARRSGGRRKWFRICLPKIKIISFKKRKVRFDTKAAALKATHSIMFEASKVHQLRLQNHASNTQHEVKENLKERTLLNNKGQEDQSKTDTCHKPKRKGHPVLNKGNESFLAMKVTTDYWIGMSIILITLLVMSISGRIYAILCMSAWFYCVPLLRPSRNVTVSSNEDYRSEFKSESFKKKMVARNHLLDHEIAKAGFS